MALPSPLALSAQRATLLRTALLLLTAALATAGRAQPPPTTPGKVILVLPFTNRSGQPTLDWIGESFPDTLNQRLSSAGFFPITRDDRQFALDHLGLPVDLRPTRATTLRIAETLDADYVIVGSYTTTKSRIDVQARVLEVNALHLSPPVADSSELARLFDVENALSWTVARAIDPHLAIAQSTFLAASSGIPLPSFENYIRGVDAASPTERIKHLQAAVQATPNYTAATLALGRAFFAERDYDRAAATLARIPRSDRRSLEAGFYMGLARFNTGKYAEAEAAFSFVATRLPLPEVVNNQGVAVSRQGRDAAAFFQRLVTEDPADPDFHFNLAVALLRRRDFADAEREAAECLKLRPADTEAAGVRDAAAHSLPIASPTGTAAAGAPQFAPLERVRRTYSEAAFRQASFELDQIRSAHLRSLSAADRTDAFLQQGQTFLAEGFLPEAEQQFQQALAANPAAANAPPANPQTAAAHAGLAEVRERSGNVDDARAEAELSLRAHPNIPALLVLARLSLRQNALADAAGNVSRALQLNPRDTSALGMRQALVSRGQPVP